jgi:hypothetical protein
VEIVNTTPIVADALLIQNPELGNWILLVTAKATFNVEENGSVALDRENPFPLLQDDEETEFGLLPRDNLPRWDDVFEVIVLGQAHAPGGKPASQMDVSFAIDREIRRLRVFGDRAWAGSGLEARITRPQPFTEMPLTYERAFGGTCEILIDRESPVDVADPNNPAGRGLDPGPAIQQMAKLLNPPRGYPQYEGIRLLPNVEHPRRQITKWDDAPKPASFATVPLSTALHMDRGTDIKEGETPDDGDSPFTVGMFHRAHPECMMPLPRPDATVRLEGMTPVGKLEFKIPQIEVFADFQLGQVVDALPLKPHLLVLLPEEMKFYLVYRNRLLIDLVDEDERGVRFRIEKGWHQPQEVSA